MSKLTGRTRYRVHKTMFRNPVLVLQLEVEGLYYDGSMCELETWWIDAKPEQIMMGRFVHTVAS